MTDVPGLYYLGLLFQYSFTSMLVHGAGRDAAHVVDRTAARMAERAPMAGRIGATSAADGSVLEAYR